MDLDDDAPLLPSDSSSSSEESDPSEAMSDVDAEIESDVPVSESEVESPTARADIPVPTTEPMPITDTVPVPVPVVTPSVTQHGESSIGSFSVPEPVLEPTFEDMVRRCESLAGQNAELKELIEKMKVEAQMRADLATIDWRKRFKMLEEAVRNRLNRNPSLDTLEEARRLSSVIGWTLCELREARGSRK